MSKIGEVIFPCDEDFENIKRLCLNDNDWQLNYSKSNLKVWIRKNELSAFHMIKAKVDLDDVPVDLFYDVCQDGEYRPEWDDRMIECFEICYLSPFSDIGYFSIKSPKPLKNRDFVTQRCWLDYGPGREKIIFNHSVNHAKYPPKKGFIRGISYLTGCFIVPTSANSCTYYYLTQSDPGGSLPSWIVNTTTKVLAPKMIKKMYKACLKYEKWKSKHNPTYKPWYNPEQIKVPKLDLNDILEIDVNSLKNNSVDESQLKESEVEKNDDEADDS